MKANLIVLLVLATLIACAPRRTFETPAEPELVEQDYRQENDDRLRSTEPVADWWRALNEPELDQLIQQAFIHNHDVRIAFASINESRARLREAGFDRYPTATATGSATYTRISEEGVQGPLPDPTTDVYDVGIDAIWEIDLFGRVSERIRAAEAVEALSISDLQGVYVAVAAEVARNYMELRGAQHQLDVAIRNKRNQEETYELIEALTNGGRSSELDLQRAKAQLARTRASIPPFRAAITATLNRLSVLTGEPPGALDTQLGATKAMPSVPVTIAVGDPAGLLKRRPDIRSAEATLARSNALYNLEATDVFPKVDIIGSLGFLATNFADLFTGDALRYAIGPSITWSAFDIGRQRAQIAAADAQYEAALARYQQVVLLALEEVDTALAVFSREEERRRALQEAGRASAEAARIARVRYEAGLDTFLDYLDAERTLLETELELARSEVTVSTNLIAIYKALGGGWEGKPVEPPSPADVQE